MSINQNATGQGGADITGGLHIVDCPDSTTIQQKPLTARQLTALICLSCQMGEFQFAAAKRRIFLADTKITDLTRGEAGRLIRALRGGR